MAFILGDERDADPDAAFRRYRAYLQRESHRFPAGACALATSEWYFDPNDHRSPHDAWLERASLSEPAEGSRLEIRHVTGVVELLGAYHDLRLFFTYPRVYQYEFSAVEVSRSRGHTDWRYDEFRLSGEGRLVHEIEWRGYPNAEGARWVIEADDVLFRWESLAADRRA